MWMLGIEKLYEALSSLYVSMYELDSFLIVNCGDIFADSYFLKFVMVLRINSSLF